MAETPAISRRIVLACGAAALVGLPMTVGAAGTPPIAPQNRRMIMLDQVTVSDFAPHLGSRFTLEGSPEGVADLELFKAEGLGFRGVPGGQGSGLREPFSLLFLGPESVVLPQGTYTLIHPALGTITLFLVPIGPRRDGGLRYEAIFG